MQLAVSYGTLRCRNVVAEDDACLDVHVHQCADSADKVEVGDVEAFSRCLITCSCIEVLVESLVATTHKGSDGAGNRIENRMIEYGILEVGRYVIEELLVVLHHLVHTHRLSCLLAIDRLASVLQIGLHLCERRLGNDVVCRERQFFVVVVVFHNSVASRRTELKVVRKLISAVVLHVGRNLADIIVRYVRDANLVLVECQNRSLSDVQLHVCGFRIYTESLHVEGHRIVLLVYLRYVIESDAELQRFLTHYERFHHARLVRHPYLLDVACSKRTGIGTATILVRYVYLKRSLRHCKRVRLVCHEHV